FRSNAARRHEAVAPRIRKRRSIALRILFRCRHMQLAASDHLARLVQEHSLDGYASRILESLLIHRNAISQQSVVYSFQARAQVGVFRPESWVRLVFQCWPEGLLCLDEGWCNLVHRSTPLGIADSAANCSRDL